MSGSLTFEPVEEAVCTWQALWRRDTKVAQIATNKYKGANPAGSVPV